MIEIGPPLMTAFCTVVSFVLIAWIIASRWK